MTIGPALSGAIPSPRRLAKSRAVNAATSTAAIPCAIEFTPTQASQRRHLRTGATLVARAKDPLAANISTFVHRRFSIGSIRNRIGLELPTAEAWFINPCSPDGALASARAAPAQTALHCWRDSSVHVVLGDAGLPGVVDKAARIAQYSIIPLGE